MKNVNLKKEIEENLDRLGRNCCVNCLPPEIYEEFLHHNPRELFDIYAKRCALFFNKDSNKHIKKEPELWYINTPCLSVRKYNENPKKIPRWKLRFYPFFRSQAEAIATVIFLRDIYKKANE